MEYLVVSFIYLSNSGKLFLPDMVVSACTFYPAFLEMRIAKGNLSCADLLAKAI